MSFLESLIKKGIIKEEQIPDINRRATQKYEGSTDEVLMEMGLDEKTLLTLKSEFFGIPERTIDPKSLSFDLLKYIPQDSAVHYHFVPLALKDGVLEVGAINPEDIQAMDALQFISAKLQIPFKLFVITKSDFELALENYKGLTGEVDQALSEFDTDVGNEANAENIIAESNKLQDSLKDGSDEKIVEDAPIIKIVAVILRHATEGNASDIHIENTGAKVKVRFRVDGALHTSLVLPINVYSGIVARIKILSKLRLDEKRKPQDGGFSAKIAGRKIDFRVSTFPAYYGEKVVMRILDSEKGVKPLDNLGLSTDNLAMVRDALKRPYGLILITGPTGSGKTTTLYSMINELDREQANVVSLEDPVEYHIPDMNQSQVMPEIGYTFASGLRSILRQDPNIIMVGEIRDKETAELAIQAALTGHLVLSTLHTNNAVGVVPRLIDMGIDPYLIAPTLILAIAQRLVRITCPNSKHAIPIDDAMRIMIDKQFEDLPEEFKKKLPIKDEIYEAIPSEDCPSGTRGRMAVYEMYKIDKDMQKVILEKPSDTTIYKTARAKGMLTMREDTIIKAANGDTPYQEIYNFN